MKVKWAWSWAWRARSWMLRVTGQTSELREHGQRLLTQLQQGGRTWNVMREAQAVIRSGQRVWEGEMERWG